MQADPAALSALIDSAQRTLFRLETLPAYDVDSDGSDYERYIRGEPGPDRRARDAWHEVLQADLDRGVMTTRVRVIHNPPTDYELYSCEWGYAQNQAYERIGIVDLSGGEGAWLAGAGDFWLADGQRAALMRYDEAGRYLGFVESPDPRPCVAVANAALAASVPFADWWAGHRHLWRENRAAA